MRPKARLLELIVKKAKEVRNRRYYVKRGVIDWSAFPFSSQEYAISVQMDDSTLLRTDGNTGILSLEFATTIKELKIEPIQIEDRVIDEFDEDAEEIMRLASKELQTFGRVTASVLLAIDVKEARSQEFHDVTYKVQGTVVSVPLKF